MASDTLSSYGKSQITHQGTYVVELQNDFLLCFPEFDVDVEGDLRFVSLKMASCFESKFEAGVGVTAIIADSCDFRLIFGQEITAGRVHAMLSAISGSVRCGCTLDGRRESRQSTPSSVSEAALRHRGARPSLQHVEGDIDGGSHGDGEVVGVEAVDAVEAVRVFDEAEEYFPYSEVDDGGEMLPRQMRVDEGLGLHGGREQRCFDLWVELVQGVDHDLSGVAILGAFEQEMRKGFTLWIIMIAAKT